MEATAQSLAYIKLTKPLRFSSSPSPNLFLSQNSISASHFFTSLCFKSSPTKQQHFQLKARQLRNLRPVNASDTQSPSSEDADRWLLQPDEPIVFGVEPVAQAAAALCHNLDVAGDGDTRHIGFRVPMPNAFEIASSVVTVGRLPEKADMVIPVATVSGLHARIKKKEGNLLVTDLDSTNGTFIDDKRLRPGEVAAVSPGSCITFGDTHLAMFRVLKLENVELPSKPEESEIKLVTDVPADSPETAN